MRQRSVHSSVRFCIRDLGSRVNQCSVGSSHLHLLFLQSTRLGAASAWQVYVNGKPSNDCFQVDR